MSFIFRCCRLRAVCVLGGFGFTAPKGPQGKWASDQMEKHVLSQSMGERVTFMHGFMDPSSDVLPHGFGMRAARASSTGLQANEEVHLHQ